MGGQLIRPPRRPSAAAFHILSRVPDRGFRSRTHVHYPCGHEFDSVDVLVPLRHRRRRASPPRCAPCWSSTGPASATWPRCAATADRGCTRCPRSSPTVACSASCSPRRSGATSSATAGTRCTPTRPRTPTTRPTSPAGPGRSTTPERRDRVARLHRAAPDVDWRLFELAIDVAVVTHRADFQAAPDHRIWHAPAAYPPLPPPPGRPPPIPPWPPPLPRPCRARPPPLRRPRAATPRRHVRRRDHGPIVMIAVSPTRHLTDLGGWW